VDLDEVVRAGEVDRMARREREAVGRVTAAMRRSDCRRGCRPDRRAAETISPKARAAAASTGIGS
jgi:hypothetical protein